MTTQIIKSLLIAALLSVSAARAEGTVEVVNELGKPVAQFKIGDSRCVLKDDQVRCTIDR
jgi:hypothetical protein